MFCQNRILSFPLASTNYGNIRERERERERETSPGHCLWENNYYLFTISLWLNNMYMHCHILSHSLHITSVIIIEFIPSGGGFMLAKLRGSVAATDFVVSFP